MDISLCLIFLSFVGVFSLFFSTVLKYQGINFVLSTWYIIKWSKNKTEKKCWNSFSIQNLICWFFPILAYLCLYLLFAVIVFGRLNIHNQMWVVKLSIKQTNKWNKNNGWLTAKDIHSVHQQRQNFLFIFAIECSRHFDYAYNFFRYFKLFSACSFI